MPNDSDKEPALVMDRLLHELSSASAFISAPPPTGDHDDDQHAATAAAAAAATAAAATALWQYKLKVGEALVQSLQRCGEAMPVYAPRVLPAFIKGGQPGPAMVEGEVLGAVLEEAHFRASCLSGLGDVCECLGWSLQRHVHDVCGLATGILAVEARTARPRGDCDKEVAAVRAKAQALVRRGAAFLLERLALGLGPSRVLAVLEPALLQEVAAVAQRAAERDGDDVVRLHARRAVGAFEEALLAQVYERVDPSAAVTALRELSLGVGEGRRGLRLPGVGRGERELL